MLSSKSENVKVLIRCRPFNQKELINHSIKCIEIQQIDKNTSQQCIIKLIHSKRNRRRIARLFRFDAFYDENQQTEQIFHDFIQSLVCDTVLHGYSGTVFAYGQTGSGKSWTITGCPCHSEHGLISNAIEYAFNLISHHQININSEGDIFIVKCAYLEIYNEELHDLLYPRHSIKSLSRLELRENPRSSGVRITNLTWKTVSSIDECMKLKRLGDLARTMGSTQMNRDSSRSHTMFSLLIQSQHKNQTKIVRQGKLNFVDLAGSERQMKTGASGQQLLESAKINLSLSALNKVISSLVHTNTTHIPYRDSKLTRLLQDSIGGTTKTIMIACISPSEDNYDETLCTLRYASRTKNIRNIPIINENASYALLQQYAEEIQRLRAIINSSNKHTHSLLSMDTKIDDQHSLKTIYDHEISSSIKCQRTVSCQTISIQTDRIISTTRTNNLFKIFDENQMKYQILAWHSCQIRSISDQQLMILVKEQNWLGTLTVRITNDMKRLVWKNNLHNREHQFYLNEQEDSCITHFEIEESNRSLILYTSSSYIILDNKSFSSLSYQTSSINTHFITFKETNGIIYYLADMLYALTSNQLILFLLDQTNHYQLHHIMINERNLFENSQEIEVEHCCCFDRDNQTIKSKFISCSHFLSFINMSCEIDEEKDFDLKHLHFVNLDTYLFN